MKAALISLVATVLMFQLAACRTNKEVTKAQAMTQLEAQHLTITLNDTTYMSPIILKAIQSAIAETPKASSVPNQLPDTSKLVPIMVRHAAASMQDTTSTHGQHWEHTTTESRTQPDTDVTTLLKIFIIFIAFSIFLLVIRYCLDKV